MEPQRKTIETLHDCDLDEFSIKILTTLITLKPPKAFPEQRGVWMQAVLETIDLLHHEYEFPEINKESIIRLMGIKTIYTLEGDD